MDALRDDETSRQEATPRVRRVRREAILAAVAYSLVLMTAYNNVVFFGESLVYSNNLNLLDPRVTASTHGPDAHPRNEWGDKNLVETPNLQDPSAAWTQWETSGEFLRDSLLRLELPLWDPFTGGGVPAMTNLTPSFFFPPYFLMVVLGGTVLLKNAYFLLLLWMAAWCTWALLRRSGLSWVGSFVGGLVFLLSGGLSQTTGSFIGQTACCLPVALLITRWFLEHSSWPRAVGLAAVFASIALSSFPPLSLAIFSLTGLYALTEILNTRGCVPRAVRGDAVVRFVCACVLGMGLTAFYYVPTIFVMQLTPQVTDFYRTASSHTNVGYRDLLQLFDPALMGGTPVWANDPIPRISSGTFHYLGAVPLLLAFLAGPRQLRRPLWLFALLSSPVVAGFMLGFPPFAQLRQLPVLHNIHFGNYYGIVLDFLFSLLAAAGFERLLERQVNPLRIWTAVLAAFVALFAIAIFAFDLNVSTHPAHVDWLQRFAGLVILTLAAATLLFAAVSSAIDSRRLVWCWMLVALVLVEGTRNASFPRQERWDAWGHPPPYVQALQHEAGLERVASIGSALYANSGAVFGIMQLDSLMAFNPPRIFELYRRYFYPQAYLFLRDATQVAPESVFDAGDVGYVATPDYRQEPLAELKSRGYQVLFADGYMTVFKRSTYGRYFFTSDYELASKDEALERIGKPRATRQIVLEEPPVLAPRPNPKDETVPVTVRHLSNNLVQLSLVAPRPGLLYASESFFQGWQARINGRTAAIRAANYAFRAVEVPAGPVDLEFRYVPTGFRLGLGVSAASLLIGISALIVGRHRTLAQKALAT